MVCAHGTTINGAHKWKMIMLWKKEMYDEMKEREVWWNVNEMVKMYKETKYALWSSCYMLWVNGYVKLFDVVFYGCDWMNTFMGMCNKFVCMFVLAER